MRKVFRQVLQKQLFSSPRGASLVEVVIGVVILGLIIASVAPVIGLITKSQFSWGEQRVAESLTRNQIEYIKVASYIVGNETHPLPQYAEVPVPDNSYNIDVVAQPIDQETKAPLAPGQDEGIQEITISICHVDRLVLQTESYKVDRLGVLAR